MRPPRTSRRVALILGVVASGITCTDAPTGPQTHLAELALAPAFSAEAAQAWQALAAYNISANNIHVVLRRPGPPEVVLKDTTVSLAPGQVDVSIELTVPVNAPDEQLDANLQIRDGATVLFEGSTTVKAVTGAGGAAGSGGTGAPIPIQYVGPGATVRNIRISPRDQVVATGAQLAFSVAATDASGQPVSTVPIAWSLSDATLGSITQQGVFTAGTKRGTVSVRASTLTSLTDAVSVAVVPPAQRILVVSGSGQAAIAGKTVAQPFVVEVQAADGLPVPGATVAFSASEGASLSPTSATTDNAGRASASMTLSRTPGTSTFTATVTDLAAVSVTATGTQPPPSSIVIVSGDAQAGAVGTAATQPLTVQVNDEFGAPVSGATVAWAIAQGGGSLSSQSATTGPDGRAAVSYTFGTTPGSARVTATVTTPGGPATAGFSLTARSGSVASLRVVSGAGQSGVPKTVLAPFVVQALDALGNPVPGASIAWVAPANAGVLGATQGTTDSNGQASSTLTLGTTAGQVTVTASTGGGAITATFDATILTGPAATLVKLAGDGQSATAGSSVNVAPSVKLIDAFGNAIPGAAVTFAVATGGGSVTGASATTNANGVATVGSWTLGSTAGTNTLTATSGSISTTFSATGTTSAPSGPYAFSGSGPAVGPTASAAGQPFASGYSVLVVSGTAASGTPAPGIAVTFTLRDPASAIVTTIGATSNASGIASVAVTQLPIPWVPGIWTLKATLDATPGPSSSLGYSISASPAAIAGLTLTSTSLVIGGTGTQFNATLTNGTGSAISGLTLQGWILQGSTKRAAGGLQVACPSVSAGVLPVGTCPATFSVGASNTASGTGTLIAGAADYLLELLDASSTVVASATVPVTLTTAAAAPNPVTSVMVAPHADTLASLGETVQLAATAKDSAGVATSGSFTWVSRTPAAATVNGSGQVVAVTNGSSWIVATESGGLRDSALVVVQQRVATVTVTPGSRSIYLTRSFQFTAAAVDGLGHPIGSPTFTWASSSPTVATVDSSGLVTGTALGNVQVRATTGGITGVASIGIVTPITRIAVGRDSSGVAVTDTTTLAALGYTRRFRAVAYDTLDTPMTGVTFTWSSTNGSVGLLDSLTATTARATAAANGSTSIVASAQGVSGSATLRVQQQLAGIELSPAVATVAPTGTVALIARGVDANGRYIPGGTFTYASGSTGVATVNASTGVVTGVATGTANVTATSGSTTSNAAVITVSNSVPPKISFGRDTIGVGRGSSTSVPIFLSTPSASNVTVTLAVADTVAYFSPASVTIPAGQTSINATLYGHNAGSTTVIASDGGSTGYAPDTAKIAVQATVAFATSGYSMNATDSRTTQVLLSDPSPAGGTYVTFAYGTPNVASVSPNPAYIPAGQLAADVVITGTSTATSSAGTTITPSAIGVNGTAASVTVYPATLTMSTASERLGAGQYGDMYVYTQTWNSNPLVVTLTSSDSTTVSVPHSITIPAGQNYVYFRYTATAVGSATITPAAGGWMAAGSTVITSTTPRITSCCGTSLTTTAPAASVSVYTTDSTGYGHARTNSLVVRLRSSDSTVMRVLDTVVTIGAGSYTTYGRVIPGGAPGSAYIYASAGGHTGDSTAFTVTGPKLEFGSTYWRLGAGQEDQSAYVYTPYAVASNLPLTITSSDTTIIAASGAVTIASGSNYVYFTIRGKRAGSASLIVTAPGYSPDTMTVVATPPALALSGGGTLQNFAPPVGITVYAVDSVGTAHDLSSSLAVSFRSTDTTVVKVDSTATIAAGSYYAGGMQVRVAGLGTAQVIAAAPGYAPDTVTYTVVTPRISFGSRFYRIGARQERLSTDFYVWTPNTRSSALPVTLTQKHPSVLTLSATALSVDSLSNNARFGFKALVPGVDTIISSAPGYDPDTMVVVVTTPRIWINNIPSNGTTTNPPFGITMYVTDSLGSAHYASDTVRIRIASSDTTVLKPVPAYIQVLPGEYYRNSTVNIVGPGTASLTVSDSAGSGYTGSSTNAMSITGPSLYLSSSSMMLGMRQTSGASGVYAWVQNAVSAPLTVNLASTSGRVLSVPASVTIPAGSNYAYFKVDALDTLGTVQVQATATGYTATSMNVQVTQPKFAVYTTAARYTTAPPTSISVYATDANGNSHEVTEDVAITLTSSASGVAAVDSSTVVIPAGNYYNGNAHWAPGVVGTARITASDGRAVFYQYGSASVDVSVSTPPLGLSWGSQHLGVGQYVDRYAYTPDYMQSSTSVAFSHAGTARATTAPAGGVTIAAGSTVGYFRLTGASAGTDSLIASITSPAHLPDTAYTVVTQGRIDPIVSWPTSLAAGDSVLVTLYARDAIQDTHPVASPTTWTLAPNANVEFRSGGATSAVITSATIPADADHVQFWVKAKTAGTASATFTSADYASYTASFTVNP